ncbi:nuclear transport factor 2 family protein [Paenibacillus tarimensis]
MKKFKDETVGQMYEKVDGGDVDGFLSYLEPDVVFIFGSEPAVYGKESVRAFARGLLSQVNGVKHDLLDVWDLDGKSKKLVKGEVTYALKTGNTITLPFLNLFVLNEDLITEFQIYADPRRFYESL